MLDECMVGVYGFKGSRFHSCPWTVFGMHFYEKSVTFVKLNPKFGVKYVII